MYFLKALGSAKRNVIDIINPVGTKAHNNSLTKKPLFYTKGLVYWP